MMVMMMIGVALLMAGEIDCDMVMMSMMSLIGSDDGDDDLLVMKLMMSIGDAENDVVWLRWLIDDGDDVVC
jgi:hypothetical protein